ncbi:helix-turn-helix domain-containing protein [Psychromarinibacter halotolerans]|uniref:Short-chain fatty acyl-CoA regulator family protein n=1 Tax=Psychromarinibacter halotolerans TaxID=1775175 RepID=A0ABV7GV51_9RHOB|nr:XRE family transcriptional regulator [Psychromarinibacter halotolerans]MDF0596148.1 short-chain fatty acyl-CoA regulator family protein [Psychromarinibacter halotolerans]
MPAGTLTGSRIRERRVAMGLKQSMLAQTVGISAAYLNLIEHNKRRIAGKLLADIARTLGVDPAALAEGAGAALVGQMRDAAAAFPEAAAEETRAEEFAGRFPGWARLVTLQRRRIRHLERVAESLTDRLGHDPHLAASLHELLSTVTAINATSSILVEPGEIESEWRDRFHRNIHEDSERLADTSRALVSYLEASAEAAQPTGTPQEELEAWLAAQDYHLAALEGDAPADPQDVVAETPDLTSAAGRSLAVGWARRYREDATALPLPAFADAARETGGDPAALAARFGVGMGVVLRRLAAMPEDVIGVPTGLVICDGSGTLTARKPINGFPLPRFGAACPLWPLYQALSRPLSPVRSVVETAGRDAERFVAYAVADPVGPARFDAPPVFESVMLILPHPRSGDTAALKVGTSCRICPQADCPARREPSILAEAA